MKALNSKWIDWVRPNQYDKNDKSFKATVSQKNENKVLFPTGIAVAIFSELVGETILLCADGYSPRETNGFVIYHESEVRILKGARLTPEQYKLTHAVKKVFQPSLISRADGESNRCSDISNFQNVEEIEGSHDPQ